MENKQIMLKEAWSLNAVQTCIHTYCCVSPSVPLAEGVNPCMESQATWLLQTKVSYPPPHFYFSSFSIFLYPPFTPPVFLFLHLCHRMVTCSWFSSPALFFSTVPSVLFAHWILSVWIHASCVFPKGHVFIVLNTAYAVPSFSQIICPCFVCVCMCVSGVRNVQWHICSMSRGQTMAFRMILQTSCCSPPLSGRGGEVKSH